jgi:hypothetical protein
MSSPFTYRKLSDQDRQRILQEAYDQRQQAIRDALRRLVSWRRRSTA